MPAELPNTDVNLSQIFNTSNAGFSAMALDLFNRQYALNEVYRAFVKALHVQPGTVQSIMEIPFLPISFFKTHAIICGCFQPKAVFESSGTTQALKSRHYIKSLAVYRESFIRAFELFYGNPADWCVIGLLPSYLERQDSSLVVMVDELVKISGHPDSGFYLYEHEKLHQLLLTLEQRQQKTLLIGVTFALLDFAAQYSMQLNYTIVMETGGMKGRREEWTRQQVHEFLKKKLGVTSIHAEYGMTELLSQAYSYGEGVFNCPPWMKVLLRDEDDPLHVKEQGTGAINVIDLANKDSCSFIATDDMGKVAADGSFEVIGRLDNSDIRGCSLMVV